MSLKTSVYPVRKYYTYMLPQSCGALFGQGKKKKVALWDLPNRHVALACNKANIYIKHNTAIYLDA